MTSLKWLMSWLVILAACISLRCEGQVSACLEGGGDATRTHDLFPVLDGKEGRDARSSIDLLEVHSRCSDERGPLGDKLSEHLVLREGANLALHALR